MTENSKTTTPIVPRTDPISISQESNGTIRVQATNAPTLSTSWVPSWIKWTWSWSWKPTSAELLLKSEAGMLKHSGLQFEQTLVKAGNHEINTIKIGQGPPLVMLHGFGAGLGFWVCNLKELSEHHTVYAVDLPGFGRSSRNPFKGSTAEEAEEYFLTSLESWRKHMQLDQFTLLGHSFGGYLAGCYTLRHPQNVQHLILADPWGIPQRPPEVVNNNIPLRWRIVRRVATMFNPLTIIRAAGPYGPGLISKFRKDIEQKFQHVYPDTSVVSQYIYHLNAQSPAGEVAFALLNESLGWAKNPLIDRLPNLHHTVPVTMLYGSNTWMDKQAGQQLKETLGNRASIHVVPRSGHHIYVDNHEFFNTTVIDRSLSILGQQS